MVNKIAKPATTNPTKVNVVVRCRGLQEREKKELEENKLSSEMPFEIYPKENAIRLYAEKLIKEDAIVFDHVFVPEVETKDIYSQVLADYIQSCCEGYNTTCFAYGQTSSGKTFTMMGTENQPGIIPLSMLTIFEYIKNKTENRTYLLRVSYMEIYNEKVIDLLSKDLHAVELFEDKNKNISFDNLTEEIVSTREEVMDIIAKGEAFRKVAKTFANDRSSRSHTVFRMVIERKDEVASSTSKKVSTIVKIGHLNLVDLAGSENATKHGNDERFQEGKNINLSLLHLKEVIMKLSKREKVLSFRNSKLTRILGKSLSGNAKIAVICNISPSPLQLEQSRRTLEFGNMARKIDVKPEVNAESDNALILKYQNEIDSLQHELLELRAELTKRPNSDTTKAEVAELEKELQELQRNMVNTESLKQRLQNAEQEKKLREEKLKKVENDSKVLEEMLRLEALAKQEAILQYEKTRDQLTELEYNLPAIKESMYVELKKLEETISYQDQQIALLHSELYEKDQTINELKSKLSVKDEQYAILLKELALQKKVIEDWKENDRRRIEEISLLKTQVLELTYGKMPIPIPLPQSQHIASSSTFLPLQQQQSNPTVTNATLPPPPAAFSKASTTQPNPLPVSPPSKTKSKK